jgi:hypothetical protein
MKTLLKEFELQEAVTTIGVQCIIVSVEEQYVEELNKDYFGYANQIIKMLLTHLRMNWCKVMTKERTNATEAFYQAWVPLTTHIITFGHQLNKQQKKCKNINVIISEEAKTPHFVGQMYKSNYYTKEQMTKYKMQVDINKTWLHTLQFLTKLFPQRKAYRDDRAANSSVGRISMTYQPIAALFPPPVTLPPAISTLRALRNHLQLHRSMLPRSVPLPRTNWIQRTYYARNYRPNASSLTLS